MALSNDEIEKRISDSYEVPNNVLLASPKPLVTVRTSTFQQGPYIKDCIEGVLKQKTDFAFEFIIGEDFSTDGTREIVLDYAKRYPDIIRVLTADYNVGAKANGRRCGRATRGNYMAICEGDDHWIDPLKLQKQIDFLRENPDCSLVFTGAEIRKANGETNTIRYPGLGKIDVNQYVQKSYYMATCSLLFLNSIYSDAPTEDWMKRSFAGDFVLRYRALTQGKIGYIDSVTSVVNKGVEHSWSKRKLTKKMILKEYSDNMRGLYYIDKHQGLNNLIKKGKISQLRENVYFKVALSKESKFSGLCYLILNFRKTTFYYIAAFVKRSFL